MSATNSPPSPPDWTTLAPDEQIWVRATPSTNLVLGSLVVGFIGLLAMSVVVGFFLDIRAGRVVSFAGLVLIVALLVAAYAVTKTREYLLTSDRVCTAIGWPDKRIEEIDLADVHDVTFEQSRWQRLANVGDLTFVTTNGTVAFRWVESPAHLYQQVLQFVDVEG